MYELYINGKLTEGQGEPIVVTNPATGKVITTVKSASVEQANEALQAAQDGFHAWSRTSLNDRIGWMLKLRKACQDHQDEIVQLMADEGGKTFVEAGNDFKAFLNYLVYYGEEAKHIYDTGIPEYGGHRDTFHTVLKRPVGVVVGHLAWNMPISNLGLKMAPSMASGCTCVLKPSTETPLASLYVGKLAAEIGLPAGAVNIVFGPAKIIGKALSESKIPKLISVIGSIAVGREVMNQGATSIKRFSMELGGNAPAIVMPDCDLDKVAKFIANRKVRISGQGCANINRIFVHESIHDEFVEKLVELVKKIPVGVGSPDRPETMGPMINVKTRDKMLAFVDNAVQGGAKLLYGGVVPEMEDEYKDGAWILPGILDGVTDDMDMAKNEIFGPLYGVLTFKDLDEVLERSNNTEAGLTGYLFTHDSRVIGRCVEDLEVGELQVNMPGAGPNMPHIGIKQSGLGCDRGQWSLEEYYDIRRISIQP